MHKFFLVTLFSFLISLIYGQDDTLIKANQSYKEGESAQTLLERKKAFNQALSHYLDLEQTQHPNTSSQLDEAIAATYFQLSEYAWSILYYYRALGLNPRDSSIAHDLNLAQEKLGLPPSIEIPLLNRILSFNNWFSLPQRLTLFFWLFLAAFLLGSLWLYFSSPFIKKSFFFLSSLASLLLINLITSFYFTSIGAILITPTGLYREASLQQTQLLSTPLLPGTKVNILNIEKNGYWLKIQIPEGTIGYISANSARII